MVGIDIEAIARIEYLLKNKPRIIRKFFSDHEWEYAHKKKTCAQTLTGFWCAKEAVVKAFSTIAPILVTDVEIKHYSAGAPYVCKILNNKTIENYIIYISISHAREYATAIATINLK